MVAISVLFSLALLLIGVGFLINPGKRVDKCHSIIGLAWDRMGTGSTNRLSRLYLIPGKVPLWAFRFGAATFFLAAGALGLVISF